MKGPFVDLPRKVTQHPLYEVAAQEVDDAIPPVLREKSVSGIHIEDVRSLMIAAWLRGQSWNGERS